jgi:hypothetical protein
MTVPVGPITRLSTHTTITTHRFQTFAKIPPECECFANLTHTNIGRPDLQGIKDMKATTGLRWPGVFRHVIRAHVIAGWQQFIRQWMCFLVLDKRSRSCNALGCMDQLCIAAGDLVPVL